MSFTTSQSCWLRVAALVLVHGSCFAAEIRLRGECRPEGNLLLLGHVAEVFANDAGEAVRLAEIELMPAPPAGVRRTLRLREVHDLLAARGLNLAEHRFSGANQVNIEMATVVRTSARTTAAKPGTVTSPLRVAADAIVKHLRQAGRADGAWQVDVELSPEQRRQLATADNVLACGGTEPWVGTQQFELTAVSGDETTRIPVVARVSLPVTVVSATRSLPRGAIIRDADVQLLEVQPGAGRPAPEYQSLQDVLGKETTRNVAAGQVLDKQYVRRPLLVQRGDMVTLYARSSGILVRTTARALDDGSEGDLIGVETIDGPKKERIDVRVTGPQVVEAWAQAMPTKTMRR